MELQGRERKAQGRRKGSEEEEEKGRKRGEKRRKGGVFIDKGKGANARALAQCKGAAF